MEWYDLNNRHVASVLWLAILILAGSFKEEIRESSIRAIRAALDRRILSLLVEMLVCCAVIVAVVVIMGRPFGLWTTLPVIAALFWFGLSGISLIGVVFSRTPGTYRKKVTAMVGLPAVAVALLEVSVFSFLFEFLLFIPVSTLLVCLLVVAQTKDDTYQGIRILLTVLSLGFHVSVVVFSIVTGRITLVSILQAFILPIALTVGVFPYLSYIRFMERFDSSAGSVCRRKITSTEFGDDWPFIVDAMNLCYQAEAVWVEKWKFFPLPHKRIYPVNGTAHSWLSIRGYKYRDLDEIWHQLPDGLRVDIYPIIREGLAMGQTKQSCR